MRKGGYEALAEKLGTEAWRPDFGPNAWNERSARFGAISVGARGFLVTYNVNLNTRHKPIAEFDRAQVSIDVVDTAVTKPHQAFEARRGAGGSTCTCTWSRGSRATVVDRPLWPSGESTS